MTYVLRLVKSTVRESCVPLPAGMSQGLRNLGEHGGPQVGRRLIRCDVSQVFATADSKRLSWLQASRQNQQPICVVISKLKHQDGTCPLTRGYIIGFPSSGINAAPDPWRSVFTGREDMT